MRALVARILALLLLAVAHGAHAGNVVDSVAIPVKDMERAVGFYTDVLAFRQTDDREESGTDYEHFYGVFGARVRIVRLALGTEAVELTQFIAPRGRPLPADSRSNDRWFQHVAIIVSDMDRAYAALRAHGVDHASTEPQTLPEWNRDAGGIRAFYFRDPDGNHLEILQFPKGKGQERWQAGDRLFLGIDHTAIVVANTDASLQFYRDTLGMRVAGTAENYGPEQERLNGVFGVRLRITALRADDGIGVELLDYLAPRTGRPIPVDTLANDAWRWRINFVRDEVASPAAAVRARSGSPGAGGYVSPGVVELAAPTRLGSKGLLLTDPDGHAVALWAGAGGTDRRSK
jgi:catechol 2,3-dioxygenase-like lactoylglutathione lyase family enzyme